jgi:hypothetical protein
MGVEKDASSQRGDLFEQSSAAIFSQLLLRGLGDRIGSSGLTSAPPGRRICRFQAMTRAESTLRERAERRIARGEEPGDRQSVECPSGFSRFVIIGWGRCGHIDDADFCCHG